MPELPPDDPSFAAAGADPGRRKSAADEARGAQSFAVSSAVGLGKGAPAVTTIPVPRLHYLARCIHLLGERPLAELFIELAAGDDLHGALERYARLAPAADFTGRSSRTINRSIKRLEGNGALAIKHSRGRRSNRYVQTLSGFNPASSVTDQGALPRHQRHLNGDRAGGCLKARLRAAARLVVRETEAGPAFRRCAGSLLDRPPTRESPRDYLSSEGGEAPRAPAANGQGALP